ncbi:MAG: SDR family oxidoreductase [Proteobacteria bacterium]|nr:SDR family oxidoreductase [Pseudomonadota bacterium]
MLTSEAAARRFAGEGWNVIATMRNPEAGRALAGLESVFVTRLDVEDRTSIDSAIAAGIARFGKINVVLNNAGYGLFGIFEGVSREAVQQHIKQNRRPKGRLHHNSAEARLRSGSFEASGRA